LIARPLPDISLTHIHALGKFNYALGKFIYALRKFIYALRKFIYALRKFIYALRSKIFSRVRQNFLTYAAKSPHVCSKMLLLQTYGVSDGLFSADNVSDLSASNGIEQRRI
jgi:hypothetical protein